ncbi:hypothetical protein OTB20_34800 [Streptomyces sp. H27-H1]|uniref:hypothetical protein n=1 Tax=Streptomyces sp. H27-H1 TaxID=2996461 RepID=UPI002270E59E|nr:hypothetical protein [Streptomyces sp. H27-H1]MCY0931265.1 hypothetical protein [Streptomyces sp. H27-H1]
MAVPVTDGTLVVLGAAPFTSTAGLVAFTAGCPALRAVTTTVSCLPRSADGRMYDAAVAPVIATPPACHW